jgi:outer membrane murein-binding lipoprotein Lpp
MAQVISLSAARQRSAEQAVHQARDLRSEMEKLCGDMDHALQRLRDAREAVARAQSCLQRSREGIVRARRRLIRVVP